MSVSGALSLGNINVANVNVDRARLRHIAVELLGVLEAEWDNPARPEPIRDGLAANGIIQFNRDLLHLSTEDIMKLVDQPVPNTGARFLLPIGLRKSLVFIMKWCHELSKLAGNPVNVDSLTLAEFNRWRSDPNNYVDMDIVHYYGKDKKKLEQLQIWNKQVQPRHSDYPQFTDESKWKQHQKMVEMITNTHNMSNLLMPNFAPAPQDKELHERHQKWWMTGRMQSVKVPQGEIIVLQFLENCNTGQHWQKMIITFGQNMSVELSAMRLSTYLTSVRLDALNWRGSLKSFILHFQLQADTHNELSDARYDDNMLIKFLHAAFQGVPTLQNALLVHKETCQASGARDTMTFKEHVQKAINAAAPQDAANSKSKRNGNVHEIFVHQFDDGSTDNGYETAIVPYTGGDVNYDLNVHDIDTDIDELMSFEVNQAQRGSSSRSFPNSNFGNRSNGYNNRIINVRMSRET